MSRLISQKRQRGRWSALGCCYDMLRCIRCGIRTCSYFMEQSAIRLRLHFEEITNLLIAVQLAIGVDYYERRGPIRADKIVCVIWKPFGTLLSFRDDGHFSHDK